MANYDYPGPCWSCIKDECSVSERDFLTAEDQVQVEEKAEFGNVLIEENVRS